MWMPHHSRIFSPFFVSNQNMNIETFATIRNLELFRPGNHNGEDFTQADIDEMVSSSNACLPYIMQSITAGEYAGNPDLILTKGIPGFLNFAHQLYLKDTLKDLSQGVSVEFAKSGEWLTATLKNVKNELAEFIRDRFNFRSIELIPSLNNPLDGKIYKNVVRSIGFLPPDIPAAVKGQSPQFAIEFAEDSFITLYSHHINQTQEDKPMETQEQILNDVPFDTTTPPIEVPAGVSLQEFNALQASVLEMQRENETTKQENATLKSRLDVETGKRESQDITMFCESLKTQTVTNAEGVYVASQTFVDLAQPLIEKADNSGIIEFAEDKKQSQRAAIQEFVNSVYQMAAKGSILVPVGEYHIGDKTEPDSDNFKSLPLKEQREQAIQEFMGSADNNYSKAWRLAAESDKYRSIF